MVVLIGQVATNEMGREAFQEIDYRFLGPITKWAARSMTLTTSPKPPWRSRSPPAADRTRGLRPEDMLQLTTDVTPLPIERATPSDTELDTIVGEIAAAERPVIIAGGGRWTDARADLANFAEHNDIPVLAAWRFHDVVDNLSDIYCGEAGLAMPQAMRTPSPRPTSSSVSIRFAR